MSRYQFARVSRGTGKIPGRDPRQALVCRLLGEYEAGSLEADTLVRKTPAGQETVCLECDAQVGEVVCVNDDGCAVAVVFRDKEYHGRSFARWLAAAGRSDSASEYDLRAAWAAGEDPTEYKVAS